MGCREGKICLHHIGYAEDDSLLKEEIEMDSEWKQVSLEYFPLEQRTSILWSPYVHSSGSKLFIASKIVVNGQLYEKGMALPLSVSDSSNPHASDVEFLKIKEILKVENCEDILFFGQNCPV